MKQSDARGERYGRVKVGRQGCHFGAAAPTLARPPRWRGRPNSGAAAPRPEREFWPVLPFFIRLKARLLGNLKEDLGDLKHNLETF